MNYWVVVADRATRRGYFVRFENHSPSARWFTSRNRHRSYAFASIEDAQHVVDQLKRYGRQAKIVTERAEGAKPPAKPPFLSPIMQAPEHLREWVEKILNVGLISGKGSASTAERIKTGYRMLAREHHPDVGGSTVDMRNLTDAYAWLQGDPHACKAWFGEMSWYWKPDDGIPDVEESEMPFVTEDGKRF
jgi:hypothetical protein